MGLKGASSKLPISETDRIQARERMKDSMIEGEARKRVCAGGGAGFLMETLRDRGLSFTP